MSLHQLQDAIAALACEAGEVEAFARHPHTWAKSRGLSGKDAMIVTSIVPHDMLRFRAIHARDRASVLEALFPITLRNAREGTLEAYAEKHPYGHDDTLVEASTFLEFIHSTHTSGSLQDASARDLAAYEAGWWSLAQAPPFEPRDGSPAHVGELRLARSLAAFPVTTDIRPIIEGEAEASEAAWLDGTILLRRDADGITSAWLEGVDADVLAAAAAGHRRDDIIAKHGAHAERLLADFAAEGILE